MSSRNYLRVATYIEISMSESELEIICEMRKKINVQKRAMALDLHASVHTLLDYIRSRIACFGILGFAAYKILVAEQRYGQTCSENNAFTILA